MIGLMNKREVKFARLKEEAIYNNDSGVLIDAAIICRCRLCDKEEIIPVNYDNVKDYCSGVKVQVAFPYLNADMRELVLSQTCPKCWADMFKDEE